jgi:hypothetical protein
MISGPINDRNAEIKVEPMRKNKLRIEIDIFVKHDTIIPGVMLKTDA